MSSEAGRRAQHLIQTLRTMRKWGFSIIQDEPGKAQDKADQLKRAKMVAHEEIGLKRKSDGDEGDG